MFGWFNGICYICFHLALYIYKLYTNQRDWYLCAEITTTTTKLENRLMEWDWYLTRLRIVKISLLNDAITFPAHTINSQYYYIFMNNTKTKQNKWIFCRCDDFSFMFDAYSKVSGLLSYFVNTCTVQILQK